MAGQDVMFNDDVAARVGVKPRTITMADYTARRNREAGTPKPWDMPKPRGKAWRPIARRNGPPIRVYSPYWTADQIDAWEDTRADPETYATAGNPYRDRRTGKFTAKPKAAA